MIDPQLLNLLPPLRRARGDRLYGPDQKHWVDLWKQDGTWLLGHRPEGAAKEWKNQVDKGLSAWAPSHWPRRLEQLVPQLIPGTTAVRVFRNPDRAPSAPLWRPWDDAPEPFSNASVGLVRLVLPTGPGQAVAVAYSQAWQEAIPVNDVMSPAESAGLLHATAEVIRFTNDARAVVQRQSVGAAFDRHLGPTGLFRRRGLWFDTTVAPEAYPSLFRALLGAGFLMNPDALSPGVLPLALSDGEWAAWKKAAETWAQGGL